MRAERPGEAAPAGEAAFDYTAEESLQELAELAEGAGAEVLGATTQSREKAFSGDAHRVAAKSTRSSIGPLELDADFVLFDQPLSPSQQRNLERAL